MSPRTGRPPKRPITSEIIHGAYYVSAGILGDLTMKSAFHIQVAYKAPWDEIAGDAPQFAEYPPA